MAVASSTGRLRVEAPSPMLPASSGVTAGAGRSKRVDPNVSDAEQNSSDNGR